MDVREKLVELLRDVQYLGGLEEKIADHLISNGATVQEDCKDCAEATQNCIVKLQEQIAELRSAQEWVSVDDRLPKNGKEGVLIALRWGEVDIGWREDGRWSSEFVNEYEDGEVTHWMPLPQPPKGE